MIGRKGTKAALLTLVERKTRRALYVLVKNKTRQEVIAAIRRLRKRVKGDFSAVFRTITANNGSEFSNGETVKRAVKCGEIYYAHVR